MFRTALRSVRANKLRFLLPTFAVLLGVAFTSGSLIYSQSVRAALAQAQRTSQPDASVVVQPDPGIDTPLDGALLDRLRALPGAQAVRGTAEGSSFVVGRNGELVGPREDAGGANLVPGPGGRDPRYPLDRGRAPRDAGEIALDHATAERTGHRLGSRVRIVVGGDVRTVRLVGIVDAQDPRLVSGGTLTLFDTATARRQFAPGPDAYTALSLTARPGLGDAELARQARAVLPHGLRAVTRETLDARATAAGSTESRKITTLLLVFAGVSLLVAAFLVANAFTMLSAARAREHALLRVVGATRGHVLRLVLTEAAIVGAVAAVLGHLLGMGVAVALHRLFDVGDAPSRLRFLGPVPLAASFAVGILVTAVAAYVPARRAAGVPPIAALRTGLPPAAASLRRRTAAGSVLTALGAALVLLAMDAQDLTMLTLAGAVLLLGLIVLTPFVTLGITRLIRSVGGRRLGVRGRLAVENARRNPRRTAATAATLMIGLALASATTMGAAALREASETEARRDMAADLRITAVDYARIADGTAARIARVPDAAAVTPTVPASLALRNGTHLAPVGVDPRTVARAGALTVREGSLDRLGRGGIAVTRAEARARGWRLGSRVTGAYDDGPPGAAPTTLKVVAIYDGPDALTPALVPASAVPRPEADSVLVKADPGRTAALRDEIVRALDNPTLLVQDRGDAAREAARPLTPFVNIVYALLSTAVLIGALGVINTMAMAVLERVREIGVLRAVGFDRQAVASVVRMESLLVTLIGAVLGTVAGTAIGAAAVLSQEGTPLVLPWGRLAVFFAAAAVIGVLASLWPARQAARVPVLRAVQSDTE